MSPAEAREELRREVEAAVTAAAARAGPDKVRRGDIVRQFGGRGVSRSTLFAWIGELIGSGRVAEALAQELRAEAEQVRQNADPAGAIEKRVVATIPPPVRPDDVTGVAGGIRVLDLLRQALQDVEAVRRLAYAPDGTTPRNARLLLRVVAETRACLGEAARLSELMAGVDRLERFHRTIIETLKEEDPALALRVVRRLDQLAAKWGSV